REVCRISEDPVRVDDVRLGRDPARLVEHLASEVEANYTAHIRREREGCVPGSGGNVEGEVTGFRLREVEHLLQPRRRRVEGRLRIPARDVAKAVANVSHLLALRQPAIETGSAYPGPQRDPNMTKRHDDRCDHQR